MIGRQTGCLRRKAKRKSVGLAPGYSGHLSIVLRETEPLAMLAHRDSCLQTSSSQKREAESDFTSTRLTSIVTGSVD